MVRKPIYNLIAIFVFAVLILALVSCAGSASNQKQITIATATVADVYLPIQLADCSVFYEISMDMGKCPYPPTKNEMPNPDWLDYMMRSFNKRGYGSAGISDGSRDLRNGNIDRGVGEMFADLKYLKHAITVCDNNLDVQ